MILRVPGIIHLANRIQMDAITFADAIKSIPQGYDIRSFPMSLFMFCQTEDEVDALIGQQYLDNWETRSVFAHLHKIMKKPIDEIIIKFVPYLSDWDKIYNFVVFDDARDCRANIFQVAVLLNSNMLLRALIEAAGTNISKKVLNSPIHCQFILMTACELGNIKMIKLLMKFCGEQIFIKKNGQTPLCAYLHNERSNKSKEIIEMLITKDNFEQYENNRCMSTYFGGSYMLHLIALLHERINFYKNPAMAVAVFNSNYTLRKDELKKIYFSPRQMTLTNIDGQIYIKFFVNGINIEIPKLKKNFHKIRYYKLIQYGNEILVRFNENFD